MPHLPGNDLRSSLHVERRATFLHGFAGALILRSREQAACDGLPDPATQAEADVASTAISSTEVTQERRMDYETFPSLKSHRF